jgi:hypothetical protein
VLGGDDARNAIVAPRGLPGGPRDPECSGAHRGERVLATRRLALQRGTARLRLPGDPLGRLGGRSDDLPAGSLRTARTAGWRACRSLSTAHGAADRRWPAPAADARAGGRRCGPRPDRGRDRDDGAGIPRGQRGEARRDGAASPSGRRVPSGRGQRPGAHRAGPGHRGRAGARGAAACSRPRLGGVSGQRRDVRPVGRADLHHATGRASARSRPQWDGSARGGGCERSAPPRLPSG